MEPEMSSTSLSPEGIKAFRAEQGLSQVRLAEALNVSRRTVEDWEAGLNPAPGWLPIALAAIAGGLAAWEPTYPDEPEDENERLRRYTNIVRSLVNDDAVEVLSNVHDYQFRWRFAVEIGGVRYEVGDWPKGKRPSPAMTAAIISYIAKTHASASSGRS